MATRLRPLNDRIVVRRDPPATETEGGIALPAQAQTLKHTGEVLMVGPGVLSKKGVRLPCGLKPGDRVVFGSYAGVEIEIDGEAYQIMRDSDVACLVEGDGVVETTGVKVGRRGVTPSRWYR